MHAFGSICCPHGIRAIVLHTYHILTVCQLTPVSLVLQKPDQARGLESQRSGFMRAMSDAGLKPTIVYHNLTPAELYEKVACLRSTCLVPKGLPLSDAGLILHMGIQLCDSTGGRRRSVPSEPRARQHPLCALHGACCKPLQLLGSPVGSTSPATCAGSVSSGRHITDHGSHNMALWDHNSL